MKGSVANIILVGFSGVGKTMVGREVARLLGWESHDLDSEIEASAGKSISQIFSEQGEEAFRLLEKQAIREACSGRDRIISTGGGAMADPDNRELMLGRGYVVCLEADAQTILNRLSADDAHPAEVRPMLSGDDPLERIRVLKASRQPYYLMAHGRLSTDNLSVAEVAREVVGLWRDSQKESVAPKGRGEKEA